MRTYHYVCGQCGFVVDAVDRVRKPVNRKFRCGVCGKTTTITPVKYN